jgi:hypothetical protein
MRWPGHNPMAERRVTVEAAGPPPGAVTGHALTAVVQASIRPGRAGPGACDQPHRHSPVDLSKLCPKAYDPSDTAAETH